MVVGNFPLSPGIYILTIGFRCMHLAVILLITRQLCLWSPRGHGRVGLVGAVLLGRLYGCTADDALLRVQVGGCYNNSSVTVAWCLSGFR